MGEARDAAPHRTAPHRTGEDPGEPPPGAFRVIDNRVVHTFSTGRHVGDESADRSSHEHELALIRMLWADGSAALPVPGGPAKLQVRERPRSCARVVNVRGGRSSSVASSASG